MSPVTDAERCTAGQAAKGIGISGHAREVVAALNHAPGYEHVTAEGVTLTRQGGVTNLVHHADLGTECVIVRIPGAGTEAQIDRAVEAVDARAAAAAGVSAELI